LFSNVKQFVLGAKREEEEEEEKQNKR